MKWRWQKELERYEAMRTALEESDLAVRACDIQLSSFGERIDDLRKSLDAASAKIDAISEIVSKLRRAPEPVRFNIPKELQGLPVDWERMGVSPPENKP